MGPHEQDGDLANSASLSPPDDESARKKRSHPAKPALTSADRDLHQVPDRGSHQEDRGARHLDPAGLTVAAVGSEAADADGAAAAAEEALFEGEISPFTDAGDEVEEDLSEISAVLMEIEAASP